MKKSRELATQERIRTYHAKLALLQFWESRPDEVQIENHDYIKELRARVRAAKFYVIHRKDPEAVL